MSPPEAEPAGADKSAVKFDSIRSHLVSPLPDSELTCPGCFSWRVAPHPLCLNCATARKSLPKVCDRVLPLTLYRRPSLIRDALRQYKPNDERLDPRASSILASILTSALTECAPEFEAAFGPIDAIAVVPSTRGYAVHPLETIVDSVRAQGCALPPSLALLRGQAPLGHGIYDDRGFTAPAEAKDVRVLLLDDVLTTGSRLHSAASALFNSGADVVGGIVLGRRVNPDFNEIAGAFWREATARPFDWEPLKLLLRRQERPPRRP